MSRLLPLVRSLVARSVGAASLVLMLGAPASAAAPASDDWITARTKIALWTAGHVDSRSVHVDTAAGRVTLHGKVRDDVQRNMAESVARGIAGVKTVRNLLQIVPEAREKAVAVADDKLKEQVSKALGDDPTMAGSAIKVKSVDKGAVLLSGKARDLYDYLHALDIVSSVDGVQRMDSEIRASDDRNRYGRSPRAGAKGVALDDWITTDTKVRLLADGDVPALDISVDTHRGVVTLFGIVSTVVAKSAAETDARKVEGVTGVKNEIQVVATNDKAAVVLDDHAIEKNVKDALKPWVALKHVDVSVKNSVVRLTGHVGTSQERLSAAMIARASLGVRSVDDDVRCVDHAGKPVASMENGGAPGRVRAVR